jgi:hypothetical protein
MFPNALTISLFLDVITGALIGHKECHPPGEDITGRLRYMFTEVYGINEGYYCQGASFTRCCGWALL